MADSGLQGIVLPNFFASPGQALAQATQLKERREERDYERGLRLQKEAEQNQITNLNQIDKATAFDQYKIGQQQLDNYTLKQLKDIKDDALANYVNRPPAEVQYLLNQKLSKLAQWDQSAKTAYGQLGITIQDLNKTYPNVNISKATGLLMNKFASDYLTEDKNGVITPTQPINPTDYSQMLNDPNVLGSLTDDVSPFAKHIQEIATKGKSDFQEDSYTDKKGVRHELKYSYSTNPFIDKTVDESGKPTGVEVVNEAKTIGQDANGQPIQMKLLPVDQMNLILSKPDAKASFYRLWQDAKGNIEGKYQQQTGRPIDPITEDYLQRNFAYNLLENGNIIPKDFKTLDKQQNAPVLTRIQLGYPPSSGGSQKVNQGAQWATDMKIAANQDRGKGYTDQENIKRVASYLFSGNTNNKYNDVFLVPKGQGDSDKDQIQINYTIKHDPQNAGDDTNTFQRINIDDPYLEEKLIGIYQQITGSDTKAEKVPFYKEKAGGTQSSIAPQIIPTSKTPSTNKWDKFKRH